MDLYFFFLSNFHLYFLINYEWTEPIELPVHITLHIERNSEIRVRNRVVPRLSLLLLVTAKYQSSAALFSIRVSSARNRTKQRNHYLPTPPSQNKNELGL